MFSENCFYRLRSSISVISLFGLSVLFLIPSLAGPMPVGTDTMPLQGGPSSPTPEWAKRNPRQTTAQTGDIHHSCGKELHTTHCIKKCVKRSQPIALKGHIQRKVQAELVRPIPKEAGNPYSISRPYDPNNSPPIDNKIHPVSSNAR